jgi:cytoskeletal protein CcmA (bactofilin family)
MANTVSLLSYANTFGDWVVTTNALTKENNDLAANNYTKPTGTLYLNDPTLGLQVANNAVVQGQLQVTGVGSSAYVQNNLRVDQQAYFQNTALSITTLGQANIGGPLLALSSGSGLIVSNNATINGTLTVGGLETVGGTLDISGATTVSNTLTVTDTASITGNVTAQNYLTVTNDVSALNFKATNESNTYNLVVRNNGSITNNLQIGGQLTVGGNFVLTGSTVYATNTFTLSASSGVGITSAFTVNRGTSGANAAIRWNEPSKYWDILDVDNTNYYRIITDEYKSDSVALNDTTKIATSKAANTLNNSITSVNNALVANVITLNSNISSNASALQAQITANTLYFAGVDATQNTNISAVTATAAAAFNKANTGGIFTNASTFQNTLGVTGTFTASGTALLQNDVTITGNLIVNGTTTTVNSQTISAGDSLIKLAANNTTTDVVDIGFYGASNTGSGVVYHGLIRQGSGGTSPGNFYLFRNLATDPSSNTVNYAGLSLGTLNANLIGAVTGNASTATTLQNARNINGVAFNGSADITVTAAAGTLTGTTLNSGVTASSLTSVGTLTNLTVTNTITGSVSGNAGTVTNGVYTNGSYSNPSWLTALAGSKVTGIVPASAQISATNWSVLESSGYLYFQYGGVNKMRLDSSGNLVVVGNVTAYGSI